MLKAVYRNYLAEIRELDRTPTWLPGDILTLGDVGTLKSGRFTRDQSLAGLGIDFVDETGEPRQFSRSNATQRSAGGRGALEFAELVSGDLNFEFTGKGQFVLIATNLLHAPGHRDHLDRSIVITRIGHRDHSDRSS